MVSPSTPTSPVFRSDSSSPRSSSTYRGRFPEDARLRWRSKRLPSWFLVAIGLLGLAPASSAQAGANDPTFNVADDGTFGSGTGANDPVRALAVRTDGKIMVGGQFLAYGDLPRNRIARVLPNGAPDATFDPGEGPNNYVRLIAAQPDGKVLIGGSFTIVNGLLRRRIARLNDDGSVDTSFDTSAGGLNGYLDVMHLQPDGKVLVCGSFSAYNGLPCNAVARINADGNLDTGFGLGTGPDTLAFAVALQPDGKVLIGGHFTAYDGTPRNRVARLNTDGSLDASFDPGVGPNDIVWALSVQPDGKVLVAGQFTSVDGVPRNRIARLNPDGSLDTGFDPGSGANYTIDSLTLQPDGKLLLLGSFSQYAGVPRPRLARVNADGSLDTSFDPGSGVDYEMYAFARQPDGKLLVGGEFWTIDGVPRTRVARLETDGSVDTSFNPGTGANGVVSTIALQPDGKALIAGGFTLYNGVPRYGLARIHPDGTLDSSFDPLVASSNPLQVVALQADGKVLVGRFIMSSCSNCGLTRFNSDGSPDTGFHLPTGLVGTVFALAVQPDGKILVPGTSTGIARFHADGTLDTSFQPGSGANNWITSIVLQPDGKVLIGGQFSMFNGSLRYYIARLNADGSLDSSFNPGLGANAGVQTIALQPDGKVLIGGYFTSFNGTPRNGFARLSANGSLDLGFVPAPGLTQAPTAILLQPDGKVLIGGGFSTYTGSPWNSIIRLNPDGSLDLGFNPGTGATYGVSALAALPDGRALIGGFFTAYNGVPRNRLARIFAYDPHVPFCLGDGTGAACPCANTGAAGHGCANSSPGSAGALLTATGTASIGTDSVTLTCTDLTGPGLFFDATGVSGSPIPFGGGLLCATIGIVRLGVGFPTGNSTSIPGGTTPVPVHVAGGITHPGTHYVQCWYRDAVPFCTPATYNLSNGLQVLWAP